MVDLLICLLGFFFYLNLFVVYLTSIPLTGYDYILAPRQRTRHVTMLLAGRSGDRNSARSRDFLFSKKRPDRSWIPNNYKFNGYRNYFPSCKEAETWSWPCWS